MGNVIKRHNSSLTSRNIFSAMERAGMIEVLERESSASPGTMKKYKSITESGLKYGKNQRGYAGKGTSMVFYVKTFNELIEALKL